MMARWPDKLARLSDGFYRIKDKAGNKIPFVMNNDQRKFVSERHGLDIILKARQRGFTTVIQLDMLDDCLFIPNLSAGVIAHSLTDAKAFFKDKIKFAYDNLPPEFRALVPADQDSADSLRFSNGSSIRVGVSLRSGTLQRLHVSEYGKLCAKYPDRATEVKTGAFNTVHVGQKIVVESTAEGRGGGYFEMVERARKLGEQHVELTDLDFKFHFYAWWTDPGYVLNADVTETTEMQEYFDRLARMGIVLSKPQRAWFIKKSEQQGEAMGQEFPSTPDEAFDVALEGAYFAKQMSKMRAEGRICRIPILDAPVYTTWDLGVGDAMAITFWQDVGLERRAIDYLEGSGEGFGYYAAELSKKGYNYGRHYMPHDADHRTLGVNAKTRKQHAEDTGIKPIDVLPRILTEAQGVDASRAFLPQVWIDEARCARLVACLDSYRKEWDDKWGVWKDKPVHDEYSHGYKSFESAAIRAPAKPKQADTSITIPPMKSAFATTRGRDGWNARQGPKSAR
jgi:hypothetical protein